ncbi:MAG: MBL fold metallo-hydrolase [Anaerolineae bacterium]
MLVDTGYAPRFAEATARMPARLYRLLTPMTLGRGETAVERLAARGIAAGDVRTIVVTHFHADHVAGLRDFPRARIVFAASAWRAVERLRGLGAVRRAYLPALLPDDFHARADALDDVRAIRPLPPALAPFDRGVDVLGDGTLGRAAAGACDRAAGPVPRRGGRRPDPHRGRRRVAARRSGGRTGCTRWRACSRRTTAPGARPSTGCTSWRRARRCASCRCTAPRWRPRRAGPRDGPGAAARDVPAHPHVRRACGRPPALRAGRTGGRGASCRASWRRRRSIAGTWRAATSTAGGRGRRWTRRR